MAHDVFISYSRADSEVANAVCKAFDANGISYWIDKEGVISGESFAKRIVPAIKNSKITVFLSSQNSNMSVFTVKEIVIAFNNGKHIIPFRIENIGFSDQLEFFLCDLSWINAYENLQSNIQQLVVSISKLLSINELKHEEKVEAVGFQKNKAEQKVRDKIYKGASKKVGDFVNQIAFANFTEIVNAVRFEMVAVEGGTFMMGSQNNEKKRDVDEVLHKVVLNDFYIGKNLVTQSLWDLIMGDKMNLSYHKGVNLPVENVSWNDCKAFIDKLNNLTDRKYCLPTEAQWEYAARGGKYSNNFVYSGSNNLEEVSWYLSWFKGNSEGGTQPVGMKKPNELDIYDMSGNVREWCNDWYGIYDTSVLNNPKGPLNGQFHVSRGGGWDVNGFENCRVACRDYHSPDTRINCLGFRLALNV